MELGNEARTIGGEKRRNPGVFRGRVTFPMNQVLDTATSATRIKNLINFPFGVAVLDDGGWSRMNRRTVRGRDRGEKRNVERIMNVHGRRQLETPSDRSDLGE